jgi:hydroxypyruvate isomerase
MSHLAVNLSMIFTEVPLIERFALAHAHGFQHIEIQFPYELEIFDIQTQLEQYDLSLCLINVPAGDLMQGGNGLAGIPGKEIEFHHALMLAIRYAKAFKQGKRSASCGCLPAKILTRGTFNAFA